MFDFLVLSFNAFATEVEALIIGLRSGFFKLSMGVGTVIIKTSASAIDSILLVKSEKFAFKSCSLLTSFVISSPFFNASILSGLISKPIT
mgnify:CR=1 FL=1